MRAHYFEAGARVGRLTILKLDSYKKDKHGNRWWLCRCDCGTEKHIAAVFLARKSTLSCGCLRRERTTKRNLSHGKASTPEYSSWVEMRKRCLNPRSKSYSNYGGRGIRICKRWGNFENFLNDMGARPVNTSLDRINNNGDYSPSNCRWADNKTQARNKRSNIYLTYQGKTQHIKDWAKELNLDYRALWSRLFVLGWETERALSSSKMKNQFG